ncbi:helix-turn-helix domain-containing protein, partial [Levilactobacillus parabrevis]
DSILQGLRLRVFFYFLKLLLHFNCKFVIIKNDMLEIMKREGYKISEISRRSHVSRKTISRIMNDEYSNVSYEVACSLSEAMFKAVNEVFFRIVNPELYKLRFTKENLLLLDNIIEPRKIKLSYDTYSDNRKMNVDTKYAMNRRVWFSGNFAIDILRSSLELIDFDLFKRDEQIPEKEQEVLFTSILKACVDYARKLQLDNVILRLQANNIKLTDPQITFERLHNRMNTRDKVNQYLFMGYKASYKCGFRLDDFTTRHRKSNYDFYLKKRVI